MLFRSAEIKLVAVARRREHALERLHNAVRPPLIDARDEARVAVVLDGDGIEARPLFRPNAPTAPATILPTPDESTHESTLTRCFFFGQDDVDVPVDASEAAAAPDEARVPPAARESDGNQVEVDAAARRLAGKVGALGTRRLSGCRRS